MGWSAMLRPALDTYLSSSYNWRQGKQQCQHRERISGRLRAIAGGAGLPAGFQAPVCSDLDLGAFGGRRRRPVLVARLVLAARARHVRKQHAADAAGEHPAQHRADRPQHRRAAVVELQGVGGGACARQAGGRRRIVFPAFWQIGVVAQRCLQGLSCTFRPALRVASGAVRHRNRPAPSAHLSEIHVHHLDVGPASLVAVAIWGKQQQGRGWVGPSTRLAAPLVGAGRRLPRPAKLRVRRAARQQAQALAS